MDINNIIDEIVEISGDLESFFVREEDVVHMDKKIKAVMLSAIDRLNAIIDKAEMT